MTAKAAYAANKPYFSTTDENAVVNPGRMVREFGCGTAIGGILSGVPMTSRKAVELWERSTRENGGRAQVQNVSEVQQNKTAPGGETGTEGKVFSGEKVSVGMSDDQRYNLLKDRTIPLYSYNDAKMVQTEGNTEGYLRKASRSEAFSVLKKIGEQFGIFKDYHNTDVDINFGFSKGKLRESIYKQKGGYQNYGKMLSIFDELLENAVGIETHSNRYEIKGEQVKQTYVLASAFEGVNGIVPVLFEVREFKDGTKSMLHVAVNMSEIEGGRIVAHNSTNEIADAPYTLPAFNISIADLFNNINTTDGRFLKYVPNEFLSPEQIRSKQIALVEQEEYVQKKNERSTSGSAPKSVETNGSGGHTGNMGTNPAVGMADAYKSDNTDEGIYTEYIRQVREAQEKVRAEELRQEYLRNLERLEEEKREAEMDAAFWKGFDR